MNKGFTLIELLVVVLIIGILAAIALPQYQKAVERSRMAEALQYLGNFAQAQSIYYMQHNNFAADLDELNEGDITLPAPGDTFDYDAGVINASFAFLDAVRHNGIYQGGRLSIEVNPDGSINKICEEPANQTGFCTMAESAGYQRWEGSGTGTATATISCEGGVLINGQCSYY